MDVVTYVLSKNWSKKYTDEQISAIAKGMNYKGAVASSADLPVSGNTLGDVYTTSDTHTEYVWPKNEPSGEVADWEPLGSGSLVYSNNTYQETWDADTKLDKVSTTSTYSRLYGISAGGYQYTYNVARDSIPADSIVQRGANGVINTGTPTADSHAATKKYVDDADSGKLDKIGSGSGQRVYAVNADGTQTSVVLRYSAGSDGIPKYSSIGTLSANAPTSDKEVANKSYVDNSLPQVVRLG